MTSYVGKSPIGYESGIATYLKAQQLYIDYIKQIPPSPEEQQHYKNHFGTTITVVDNDLIHNLSPNPSGEYYQPITNNFTHNLAFNGAFIAMFKPEAPNPVKYVTPEMFAKDVVDRYNTSGFIDTKVFLQYKKDDQWVDAEYWSQILGYGVDVNLTIHLSGWVK